MQPDSPNLIFVDLDGTLVRSDLFAEAIFKFIGSNPLNIFTVLVWLIRGVSYAKERISGHVDMCADELPFEESLLQYLKEQKQCYSNQ